MTDKYIKNTSCNKCGSSDAVGVYQTFEGKLYGHCFSCENREDYDIVDTKEERKSSISLKSLLDESDFHELRSRYLSESICTLNGVRSVISDTGEDLFHFYPFTNQEGNISWCVREVNGKKFKWINYAKDLKLFGQDRAGEQGGKMLIITEGVCDKLAAEQMLLEQGKKYRVVSLSNGTGSAVQDIKTNYEWLCKFDTIFLAFDQDDPGKKAVEKVSSLFPPNKVKSISFRDAKDANDLLTQGRGKGFLNAIFNSKESRPDGIADVDDLFSLAITPVKMGYSFPWKGLTEATLGYRHKELWGIGAGQGCGKTEWFKEVITHVIDVHKRPAGVIFLEEPAPKTLKVIAGKRRNKRFHLPADRGGNYTQEELEEGIISLKDKIFLYNHFGAKDWQSIKSKIRYMVVVLGIQEIFLDHLTALVAQEDNEYKALNEMMEEMASLVQELDFTLFFVSHLRKPSGTPHEEGGRVTAEQFKGSGSIGFWSNFMIGLERNQQAEDETERNTTIMRVLKDRESGLSTGSIFTLRYNHETGRWLEVTGDEYDEI
jgi:twinkle protein